MIVYGSSLPRLMIRRVAVSLEYVGVGDGRGQSVFPLQFTLITLEWYVLAWQRISCKEENNIEFRRLNNYNMITGIGLNSSLGVLHRIVYHKEIKERNC